MATQKLTFTFLFLAVLIQLTMIMQKVSLLPTPLLTLHL